MILVEKLLLASLFAQIALTFGLFVWLGTIRVRLVTGRQVKMRDIALSNEVWPRQAKQVSNAADNQFQLPILFYVAVVLTLWSGTTSWLEVVLGLAFVVLRSAHAYIHTTDNHVSRRFFVYAAGFFVLMAYWIVLAIKLLLGSG